MLETGFTLIAVNLPSFWSIVSKVSAESIIRSVRSLVSLGSIRSEGSRCGTNPHSYERKDSSSTQNLELVAPKDTGDVSATIERQKDTNLHQLYREDVELGIYVQKTLRQALRERS